MEVAMYQRCFWSFGKILQISCKVTGGFFQITRKVKTVKLTLDSKYSRTTFYGTSIHLHEAIQIALRGTEKLDI